MSDERAVRAAVHDIRNELAVAIAHLEAFRDRKLEPTPERIGTVLAAVGAIDVLLDRLREAIVEPGSQA